MNLSRALALLGLTWAGCQTPVLDGLNPSSGPPGTVVEVDGSYLGLASVVWDSGLPSEVIVPSGFLSAQYFTVPMGASTTSHPVRLARGTDDSVATKNFTVTSGTMRPKPRLDEVTNAHFNIDAGVADLILMAHGANFDVGAKILTATSPGGPYTEQSTFFYRLLRNNAMNASDPATLGYPIFHYASVFTYLKNIAPGTNLYVRVKNLDGEITLTGIFPVAASAAQLDSDRDGLLDTWETNGYSVGGVFVDLPGMGADPYRKDLFVEVDWMAGLEPDPGLWAAIEQVFANAPVLNPNGEQGIAIHIDRGAGSGGGGGDVIPLTDMTRYDNLTLLPTTYSNFRTIKNSNFENARLNVFRYCVFVNDCGHDPGSGGRAEDIWCNDFYVSLGSWGFDGQRLDLQTGTFLHELGHTFGLKHGGNTDAETKPNYNSVMPYNTGSVTGLSGYWVRPSPSQFGGIDVDCNMSNASGVYTYSQGQRAALKEQTLVESMGVCDGVDVDWDKDGSIAPTVTTVSVDLDGTFLATIRDHADWAKIKLPFTLIGSNWKGN